MIAITTRIITWLLPGLLVWTGCAAPALVGRPASVESSTESAGTEPEDSDEPKEDAGGAAKQHSPMVLDEAALIRETAMEAGYAEAEAHKMAQSVINAQPENRDLLTRLIYAQLHRHREPVSGAEQTVSPTSTSSHTNAVESSPPTPESAHVVTRSTAELTGAAASRHPEPSSLHQDDAAASPVDPKPQSSSSARGAGAVRQASHAKTAAVPPERGGTARGSASAPPAPPSDAPSAGRSELGGEAAEASEGSSMEGRATNGSGPSAATDPTPAAQTPPSSTPPSSGSEEAGDTGEGPEALIPWQQPLGQAIHSLRGRVRDEEPSDELEAARLRASLGLLQLVAQEPEKAMVTLEGLDDQQLEFWRQTMMGLDVLMDADGWPKMRYRVEAASDHLQRGLSALKTLGPLQVNNLAFVSDVRSYGVYEDIGSRGFDPGEHVILYVEIGNFTVEETKRDEAAPSSSPQSLETDPGHPMYETELVGRYDILDEQERIVMSRTLPVIRDRCRHHRRDFFVAYEFHMPREVDSGYYRLELTIEDRKGEKFGSGAIEFRVR